MALELAPRTETALLNEALVDQIDADNFCSDFVSVCDLERLYLARKLQLPVDKLAPEYLAKHLNPDSLSTLINKIDDLLSSDENGGVIRNFLQQRTESSKFWADEGALRYIVDFARMSLTGGMVSVAKDNGHLSSQDGFRAYRVRVSESNDAFINLVDSDFGRGMGMTRPHLRMLIRASYGSSETEGFKKADRLEAGLAVEIATRRYAEEFIRASYEGDSLPRTLDYGQVNEDLRGGDLVYIVGRTTLLIDVKSGDAVAYEVRNNGNENNEPIARHSKVEQTDVDTYKIKEMHPSTHKAVNDQFRVIEPEYKEVVQDGIKEFEAIAALEQ